MRGFLDIDGAVEPMAIHPGPCLPDGRAIGLEDGQLVVGDQRQPIAFLHDGANLWVRLAGQTHVLQFRDAVDYLAVADGAAAVGTACAPMPGVVVSVAVSAGDAVTVGDPLLVIESMKLETTIAAGIDGTVKAIHFAPGESFDRHAMLVEIEGAS